MKVILKNTNLVFETKKEREERTVTLDAWSGIYASTTKISAATSRFKGIKFKCEKDAEYDFSGNTNWYTLMVYYDTEPVIGDRTPDAQIGKVYTTFETPADRDAWMIISVDTQSTAGDKSFDLPYTFKVRV